MADGLPVNFPLPPEKLLATYQYQDVINGFGYITLYGYINVEQATGTYNLSEFEEWSSQIDTDSANHTADTTFTFFSGAFTATRVVKGIAKMQFCWKCNESAFFSVKLYHYRPTGTVSTQLGSTWTGRDYNNANSHIDNATIDVATTHAGGKAFEKGDQIKIEFIMDKDAANQFWFGVDPKNRDGTQLVPSTDKRATTQLIARIPIRIDR